MRRRAVIASAVLAAILLVACNKQGVDAPGSSPLPSPVSPVGEVKEVAVTATEFAFSPADIQVSEGNTLALTLSNQGSVDHDWTVFDGSGVRVAGSHAHATPGSETTVLLNLAPGTYQVWCTIPGHKEAGMTGTLTVK